MKITYLKPLTTLTTWVLLAVASLHAAAQDRTLPAKTGTQWYPYLEWRLENPSVEGNPFDVGAEAVFVHHETGETVTTGLFYDGADTWAFRFTGTHTGDWTFRTASDDADLHGWTGVVTITPNPDPEAHGFMKAFGSKWGWEGTETAFVPQYVMAKEPSAYLDADGAVDTAKVEADVKEFVDGHGFTGFHLRGGAGWFDGEDPDVGFYRALEGLIGRVHERGGASHIWMWGAGRDEDDEGPIALAGGPMSEVDRRNLRYLAARLGPIPGWSMGYGFDTENAWAPREELDAWKAFLEARMAHDHFPRRARERRRQGALGHRAAPAQAPPRRRQQRPHRRRLHLVARRRLRRLHQLPPALPPLRAGHLPPPRAAVVRGGPVPPPRPGELGLQGLQRGADAARAVARGDGGGRGEHLGQPPPRGRRGRLAAVRDQGPD